MPAQQPVYPIFLVRHVIADVIAHKLPAAKNDAYPIRPSCQTE
jgi:hypothetical protein